MVVSNGAVQTINDTFVANVISKAVFSMIKCYLCPQNNR